MRPVVITLLTGSLLGVVGLARAAPARARPCEATIMRNQHGVVIELTSTTQGASRKAAVAGLWLAVVP
jgi:hypothetical protein